MCLFSLQSISAANITVHPGSTIQSAVDQASNGDTIVVYDNNGTPYTYKESITINKKINIKSNGNVSIEAKNTSSAVFTVNTNGTGSLIQNFTLTKSNYCIMINNANNCILSGNNIVAASLVGIQFYGNVNNSQVIGNTITGLDSTVGNGISFEYGKVTNNTITGNTISNFLNGIIFNDNSENNTISNNIVKCSGYHGAGIYSTDNSRSMQIKCNTVTGAEDGISIEQLGTNTANNYILNGNIVSGNKNGFWICLINSTISNNNATYNNVSGLDITGANNTIQYNTATNNGNCGITIAQYTSADYNLVSGNILNNNLAGINSASNYLTIFNNTISQNTNNGMILTANHVTVDSNHIMGNNGNGILLIGTYNSIINNIIQNNILGLCIQALATADYNTITNNSITNNTNGINSASNNTTISNNTISQNTNDALIITANHVTVDSNHIISNAGNGILLIGTNNSIINNIIQNNLLGLCIQALATADYNTITNNSITNNTNGINSASSNTSISQNTVSQNTNDGVIITANHVTIDSNHIIGNAGNGILLIGTYNSIITNIIQNNLLGLCIQKSASADYNNISNNNITNNTNGISSASPYSNFTNNNINYNNQTGLTITENGCNVYKNTMSNNGQAGLTINGKNNIVTSNRLENNLYGASFGNYNAATFNLNSVIGNTYQVYSPDTTGTLNALNNWWGSNSNPTRIYGLFNVNPWIIIQVVSNPSQIIIGANSTITADLTHNSNGADTKLLYSGYTVPDGLCVNFSSDSLGNVNPVKNSTVNGTATTIFNGQYAGISTVSASLNGQNNTTNISINPASPIQTSISVTPISGYKNNTVNLTATLTDTKNNITLAGKTIKFTLNGTLLGTAITNSNGIATLPYSITLNVGTYTILAQFIQDSTYAASNNTNNLTVLPDSADIAVTNTASNNNPNYGDNVTFTVTVKNNGPSTAQNVIISEWLSNGNLTYISDDSNGSLNLNNGIWTIGNLTSGQTATLHIYTKANTANSTTTNTATYNPVTSDPNLNNNNQTVVVTTASPYADVVVTNTASNYNPNYGDNVTFTVTVKNNGPNTAQNVIVSEWLSNGNIAYISDDSNGSLNLSNGIWSIGNLASGATATLHIYAQANTPNSSITNTATYNPLTTDPNLNNNNQTLTITTNPAPADVMLTNTISNANPKYGDTVTFTVTVTNNGPYTAQNVTVSEWLSNGNIAYISDDSNGSLNLNNGIWTIGNLASGATATLHIIAKANTPNSTITNTATYNPVTTDPNLANNSQTIIINTT